MISLLRTDSSHSDFRDLVVYLDAYLAEKDGEEHDFYDQFNKLDNIQYVIVAYENEMPVGCGALKPMDVKTMEVKRMYTSPSGRGKGIATRILHELENWALELGFEKCVLETGKRQPEAIALYQKNNYHAIPCYGQYAGMDNSLCFEKKLGNA